MYTRKSRAVTSANFEAGQAGPRAPHLCQNPGTPDADQIDSLTCRTYMWARNGSSKWVVHGWRSCETLNGRCEAITKKDL